MFLTPHPVTSADPTSGMGRCLLDPQVASIQGSICLLSQFCFGPLRLCANQSPVHVGGRRGEATTKARRARRKSRGIGDWALGIEAGSEEDSR